MMQRIRKLMAHEGGFTLIELLIVIVILGILAAIVVFAVSGISDRGTLSACKADKQSVTVASEAYYAKPRDRARTALRVTCRDRRLRTCRTRPRLTTGSFAARPGR